jgi:hypothetical protein
MRTRTLALSAWLCTATACSWIGMTRPPPTPLEPAPPAACTTSRLAPVLDTTGAVLLGIPGLVTTIYGITIPVCSSGWCIGTPTSGAGKASIIGVGLVLLGVAVVDAVSAVNGFGWASRCEDLRQAQLACTSGVEASCALLRIPPPREGKALGEPCATTEECREGAICRDQMCIPTGP